MAPAAVPEKNTKAAKPEKASKPGAKGAKASKGEAKDAAAKGAEATVPSGPPVKRPAKPFFFEVKPGAERIIRRGDKSLTAPVPLDIQSRRKGASAEESPEELVERIERELEHQFFFRRGVLKPQMCTKCGINVVSERYMIDRELGYCEDCADILHLGETKEARRMEFSLAKRDAETSNGNSEEGGDEEDSEKDGKST